VVVEKAGGWSKFRCGVFLYGIGISYEVFIVSIGSLECHDPMDGLGLFVLANGMELCI
jgi:hypothetical protein